MGLGKKESKETIIGVQPKAESTKTVVIQPIVSSMSGEKTPKYGVWGYELTNCKKLAAKIVSEIPAFCTGFSAGHDVVEAVNTCKKNDVSKKDKTTCIFKTIGKVALKITAGVVASKCINDTINNTIDLSDKNR